MSYECRHGLSYTTIRSARAGIAAKTTVLRAARRDPRGLAAAVTNDRETAAELSLFSSVEFALWDAQDDATNFQRNYSTGEVEVVDGVIYHKTEYRERRDHFAYFACSEPLAGFDTQREAFLGPYRGFHEPLGVERGEAHQLGRPRLVAARRAPRRAHPGAGRDPGGHLPARLLGEPARRQVRVARASSTSPSSGR